MKSFPSRATNPESSPEREAAGQLRSDILEELVAHYFRLNGYFCIPNYLYHLKQGGFGLTTESDLLAVRMPYQREVIRGEAACKNSNDGCLVLGPEEKRPDFVIAEVKEPSIEFNKRVRGPGGADVIASALQMLGVLPQCEFAQGAGYEVSSKLHEQIRQATWRTFPSASTPQLHVRMIVFAPESAKHAEQRAFIALQHVLDFVYKRMRPDAVCSPYRDKKLPVWKGMTGEIVKVLDTAYSAANRPSPWKSLLAP